MRLRRAAESAPRTKSVRFVASLLLLGSICCEGLLLLLGLEVLDEGHRVSPFFFFYPYKSLVSAPTLF